MAMLRIRHVYLASDTPCESERYPYDRRSSCYPQDRVYGDATAASLYNRAMNRSHRQKPQAQSDPERKTARRGLRSVHEKGGVPPSAGIEFRELPRFVPARTPRYFSNATKIPRVIWQTFATRTVPKQMAENSMHWIEKNPEYDYQLFDDFDVARYIKDHYGAREKAALEAAPSGAHRADLWRYLVIAREGGVYVDMDATCDAPISRWVRIDDDTLVVSLNGAPRFDVSQWAFAAPAGHPVVREAANLAVENLLKYRGRTMIPYDVVLSVANTHGLRRVPSVDADSGFDVEPRFDCPIVSDFGVDSEMLTGPPVFQAALESVARKILRNVTLGPGRSLSDMQLSNPHYRAELAAIFRHLVSLRPPYFGGAIRPKYADEATYRADLANVGLIHWSEN